MRREFHKQLTKLRKIQDKVLRQQSKHDNASMYIISQDMGSNVAVCVRVYRSNGKSDDGNAKYYDFWEKPHYNEIPYQRILDEINLFFGFAEDEKQ